MIAIVIVSSLIILIFIQSKKTNNDRLDGNYSGTIYIEGFNPALLNISFDGEELYFAHLEINSTHKTVEGSYQVVDYSVSFSLSFEDTIIRFIGTIDEGSTSISGEINYIDSYHELPGTFYLSLMLES